MRVILLTHGGAELVIESLAELEGVEVVGIFIETETTPQRGSIERLKRSIKYDGLAATLRKFLGSAKAESSGSEPDRTVEAADRHGIPVTNVANYHLPGSIDKLRAAKADLGIIFGTNIVKESVFSIPKLGSINLHQGLAPYYRGGPPIFWELYNDEKEVGLTVHFVAAKVDTGDIILQKKVPLEYGADYGLDFERFISDYRKKRRPDSAKLISNAVRSIATDRYERSPQDTSLGKRYRLPTKKEKDELRRRLKERLAKGNL